MLRRFFLSVAILPVFFLLNAGAQTPAALPYTMTTIGGLAPMSSTAGTQCPNLPAGVVSTDAYGDGCLAINGIFGAKAYGGTLTDQYGNLFVVDDINGVIHEINPATGIMTKVAGLGTACSGKLSSYGDNCPVADTVISNNRSAGIDSYGNILLGGYADHLIHMICLNASPLCVNGTPSPTAANPLQIEVGYMGVAAGCAGNAGGNGTSGVGLDNTPGFSYTSDTGSASAFNNSAACSTSLGEVDKPEGITTDVYGNLYYADSAASRWRVVLGPASYNGVTNPLYAVLEQNSAWTTVTAGYVYTISGYPSTTATTAGTSCDGSGTATDGFGDGCLFTSSYGMGVSGYPTGMGVDAAGNMVYTDLDRGLRVFYVSDGTNFATGTAGYIAGQKMKKAILANVTGYTGWTSVTAPPTGFNYMLAGGGSTAIGTTTPATLGSALSLASDNKMFKLAVGPQGNIYIGDSLGPARVYFYDMNTGYMRTLFTGSANVTTGNSCGSGTGLTSLSAYSDGCPAVDSVFSNTDSMSVALDPQGNLYMYDGTENVIRKVLAQGFSSAAYNTTPVALSQDFQLHFPETATGTVSGATASVSASADIAAASGTNPTTPSCTQNADNSVDCLVTVTTAPTAIGQRAADLTVALPAGSWTNASASASLAQTVSGSVMVVDNTSMGGTGITPTTQTVFSAITPVGVALDGAGNVYAASGTSLLESIGGTAHTLTTALPATPSQIAVDPAGNVYAVNGSVATITELAVTAAGAPSTYATTSVLYTPTSGTAAPQAIAVDSAGNLYVADYQSGGSSVYRLTMIAGAPAMQTTVASGLGDPVSLAVDPSGNVFVADQTATAIYEYSPASPSSYSLARTISPAAVGPIAVDVGGDLYLQAGSAVTEYPVTGSSVAVDSGVVTPKGLAVDGAGDVYSADASGTAITEVVRDAAVCNFGTQAAPGTVTCAGTLTNAGNMVTSGSITPTNFTLSGCNESANEVGALAAGASCTLSAVMTGTDDTAFTFLPTTATVGSITMEGTVTAATYDTTTTISGPSTASYVGNGTEATYTVTVAPSSTSGYAGANYPGGTPSIWICAGSTACAPNAADMSATVSYGSLAQVGSTTSGSTTVTVSGVTVGTYNIDVSYPGGSGTGSNFNSSVLATPAALAVTQVATQVSWTPSATTQQVSAAIGTGVLNATSTSSDTSVPSLAGNFVYTYTPSGGSATSLDASTYLPIGTYTLAVTFTPVDTVDYASSTASGGTFTVTQASTTAAVGASTNVVAADGSGNYTSLSAALTALPTSGGTLYLKPGTYYGQNAISYPNVQLRGLGGDPTKVILTAEDGAFSSPFTGYLGSGTGSGNANASGDQGSSTLDVTKSAYMGTTLNGSEYTPNNFYAEYLTIQNTYNTDTSTTNTYNTVSSGGTCTGGQAAQTLQALYNAGIECSSQALALWIESDQAILNNVNLTSQQDTLYAGSQGCGSYCTAARQYMWQGTITGDVDYVFGDAALVFDHTNFFTTWHGTTATGTETIEAQNKKDQTGSAGDYLSGYICNSCTLLSQSTGMTKLYYGRPYGTYSTWIMLNSYVDQVAPVGWIEFSGDSNLPTSTYGEYNTQAYTDPTVGTVPYPAGLFYEDSSVIPGFTGTAGYSLIPTGGNTGTGVTPFSARETTSTNPGTIEAGNSPSTQLTAAQAAQYYPVNFLGTAVSANTLSAGQSATWNPVTALTNMVNSFAPSGNVVLTMAGESVTILGRPETPGAGIIPTGSYAFYDSLSGATCTATGGSCAQLASGNLDASGEAYLTTSTLASGTHTITMTYGGDSNFTASTSSTFTITVPVSTGTATATTLTVTNPSSTYGGTIMGTVSVAPTSGTGTPTGTITLMSGATTLGTCILSGGSCSYTLSNAAVGNGQTMVADYAGDSTFSSSVSNSASFNVAKAVLTVTANNATMVIGGTIPTFTDSITGYVNSDSSTSVSGAAVLTTTATTTSSEGPYPITVAIGTLAANNYTFNLVPGTLTVTGATAVATGDSRTVTEPIFPAVCQALNAAITSVSNDIPTSVDATVTNPDGARIQAALQSCSTNHPGEAVELSMDSTGTYNAFLSGPLSMPANVTLLVDPGVTLFFSRNVQDYDKVSGTHTCGTINGDSATNSCLPLIDVPKTSTNAGIMGYGKLDGRGEDALLNGFASGSDAAPSSYTWWNLASQANTDSDNQQNPRFIQLESGGSNFTMYKITMLNAPMFHISTTGSFTGFTAWDIKIVTPTSARNTDGIDPGNAKNFTITKSWISDGDDNVAVGASGSAPAENISVTGNHFYAGHGESIGSYTSGGVSNVLFDSNMSMGDSYANVGSTIGSATDSNSTAIRIKSANDRGGVVSDIQYSNSCFLDHKTEIQFTPFYEGTSTTGSATPNFENILMQNLVFENDASSTGSVQFTGAANGATTNPLTVTLDNVTFPSALSASSFVTTGTKGTETDAQLTFGPGDVSSNFVSAWTNSFAGSNGDTATSNITATSLNPPSCDFTYVAPELTGPTGLPQTIDNGQTATAVVILTPTVGGAAYPTGTVTLTDALNGNTYPGTLSGSGDTLFIPLAGLSVGTHTFSATYTGDSNYTIPAADQTFGSYVVTVSSTTLPSTTAVLTGVPSTATYGTPISATVTVTGTNPSGTVSFYVNNALNTTVNLTPGTTTGTASAGISLDASGTAYSIYAVYSGDSANAGSTSSTSTVTVSQAVQTITYVPSVTTYPYTSSGAFSLSATSNSGLTVSFASTTSGVCTVSGTTATIVAVGTCTIQATQTGSNDYTAATPVPVNYTVSQATQTITYAPSVTTYPYTSSGTFSLSATSDSGLTVSFASTTSGVCTVSGTTATIVTAGTCTVQATQTGNTDYAAATPVSVDYTVSQATQTITFAPAITSYPYTSGGTFSLSATSDSGLTVSFASTTSGVCTVTGTTATIVAPGTCTVEATQAGNTDYAAATTVSVNYTIGRMTPSITLTSGMNPVLLQNSVTFTATVSSASGTPTGSVNFVNGSTVLETVALSAGAASYSTSSLAIGSSPITAVYQGDTNYLPLTSGVVTESVININVGTPTEGTSETVAPGGTAIIDVPVTPSNGTSFPIALTLTVAGLPTGATATVTPSSWVSASANTWTLPANTVLSGNTQLSIVMPTTAAALQPAGGIGGKLTGMAPFTLALLLLPFAGMMRRTGKQLGRKISVLLLLAAGMASMAGLSGCAGSIKHSQTTAKSYAVTVTVSGGSLSQSTGVTLTVE